MDNEPNWRAFLVGIRHHYVFIGAGQQQLDLLDDLMASWGRLAEENERLTADNALLRGFNGTAVETAQIFCRLMNQLLKHGPADGCGSNEYEQARRVALALLEE